MEYQIIYYRASGIGGGPGTFSADEQRLRLRGYTAARQRGWMVLLLWIIFMIWMTLWYDLGIKSQVQNFLGLPPLWIWNKLILFALMVAPFIGLAFIVNSWPGSTSPEEFEKRVVTLIGQRGKRVSFDVPNPFKSGKSLPVNFKAKTSAEADQIVEALLQGQEITKAVSIPPDVKRDILSGRYSKNEIMRKYAIPPEELEDIYKMLAGKM
jgi:hypothetical protein